MNTEEFHRKLTAILSADVQGYSRLMGEDEESTVRTLTAYRTLMFSLIRDHRGHVVDSPGDNLLAKFDSGTDAVRCAVEIQEELRIRNANQPENRRMLFRIGINLGDVIEEGDRIYGDGINVAARIEGLADGGGICISGFVYGAIKNKLSLSYEFMGEHSVKNIKDPVRVYRIRMEPDATAPIVKKKASKVRTWQKVAFPVVVIFILGAVAYILFDNLFLDRRAIDTEVASSVSELVPPAEEEAAPETPTLEEAETLKTIAVLPFENLSSDPEQGYFVDGLCEEILNFLAKIPGLSVTSRTSAFSFKDKDKTVQEIASVLGVSHILEGSVRKAGNTIRVTAQLIRAADDRHLWSDQYDRELKDIEDILSIQGDIAKNVTNELKVTLGVEESLRQIGGTDNVEAYELYLIAKGYYRTPPLDNRALDSINAAIDLDPGFALAWALKSRLHQGFAIQMTSGDQVTAALNEGLDAAQRAIELEANMPDGYSALGTIKSNTGKWVDAGSAFRKAFKFKTDSSLPSEIFATPHYMCVGYLEKAKKNMEEQLLNDPLNANYRTWYLDCLGYLDDIKQAEDEYKREKSLFADDEFELFLADSGITFVRFAVGNVVSPEDILVSDSMTDMIKEHLDSPKVIIENLRKIYAEEIIFMYNFGIFACSAAYFGDSELALDAVEKSVQASIYDNVGFLWLPVYHEVRQLPRFKEFVREIGLVDYWEQFGWPDLCHPTEDGDFVCN